MCADIDRHWTLESIECTRKYIQSIVTVSELIVNFVIIGDILFSGIINQWKRNEMHIPFVLVAEAAAAAVYTFIKPKD